MKSTQRIRHAGALLAAAAVLALAGTQAVSAQTANSQASGSRVKFPAGLQWQTLDLIGFNYNPPGFEGTPAERKEAEAIWGKTMDGFPVDKSDGKKWPVFIIQKTIDTPTRRYVFSSLDAAPTVYPLCGFAINSSNPDTPIYVPCPMRVVIQDKGTGATAQQDFPDYCVIATNNPDQPKSRNYAQVALDGKTNTAYYRIVQYGKPVPECNRAIRLK